jgi:hypothetical protein
MRDRLRAHGRRVNAVPPKGIADRRVPMQPAHKSARDMHRGGSESKSPNKPMEHRMANGWTLERREREALLIRKWKPCTWPTGRRTAERKRADCFETGLSFGPSSRVAQRSRSGASATVRACQGSRGMPRACRGLNLALLMMPATHASSTLWTGSHPILMRGNSGGRK